jgi:hypothetical protein
LDLPWAAEEIVQQPKVDERSLEERIAGGFVDSRWVPDRKGAGLPGKYVNLIPEVAPGEAIE